jgi:hypothetical protein
VSEGEEDYTEIKNVRPGGRENGGSPVK